MHQALDTLRRLAGVFDDGRAAPQAREVLEVLQEVTESFGGRPTSLVDTILGISRDPSLANHPELLISMLAQQFGAFGAGYRADRGLLERIAARGPHAQSIGSLIDGLAALAYTPSAIEDPIGSLGRYSLLRKLPCSSPDQCFWAIQEEELTRNVFIRSFPRERMNDALIARLRRWMALSGERIAKPTDFGVVDHQPYVASEMIAGIDLGRLRERRPSLPIVLALLAEGMAALHSLHAQGETHGHLSEHTIRIDPLGKVVLCLGTSELPIRESEGEDLCTLARLILGVAIDDPKLMKVLETNDREALVVAADRLEELHPELDELIAAVLWKQSDRDTLLAILARHVTREEALSLIGALVEDARA